MIVFLTVLWVIAASVIVFTIIDTMTGFWISDRVRWIRWVRDR